MTLHAAIVNITTFLLMFLCALVVDLAGGFSSLAIATINKCCRIRQYTSQACFLHYKTLAVGHFGGLPKCPTHGTNAAQLTLLVRKVQLRANVSNFLPRIVSMVTVGWTRDLFRLKCDLPPAQHSRLGSVRYIV